MSHRISKIATIVLAVLATLAVGIDGYVVVRDYLSTSRSASNPPRPAPRVDSPEFLANVPASQPAMSDPLTMLAAGSPGPAPVDKDPADLPVPPLAKRTSSLRQKIPGGAQEVAHYLANTTPDVLESFYRDRLPALGWRFAGQAGGGLVYIRPGQRCTIRISRPPASQPADVTVVVLTDGLK